MGIGCQEEGDGDGVWCRQNEADGNMKMRMIEMGLGRQRKEVKIGDVRGGGGWVTKAVSGRWKSDRESEKDFSRIEFILARKAAVGEGVLSCPLNLNVFLAK